MDPSGIFSVIPFDGGTKKSASPVLSRSITDSPPASPPAQTQRVARVLPQSKTDAEQASAFHENEAPQLSPGLVVMVSVLVSGKKEIDEPATRISNSGDISLPLIGNVQARGLSLDQLATKLTKLYREYFVQPQVVVGYVIDNSSDIISPWGYVTVLGRVKNPGRVSIPPTQDMTISGAIQKAGGLDTSAKDSAIKVTRKLPDGKSERYDVNLRRVGTQGRVSDDIILKPDDVIFVPEMIF
jgi:protein involved in polysaccharide export with SLBB domain